MKRRKWDELMALAENPVALDKVLYLEADLNVAKADVIRLCYGGDVEKFEEEEAATGNYGTSWNCVLDNATILPELEEEGHALIERRLGYLPHEAKRIRHEPFLRGLIKSHRNGLLSDDEFSAQAEDTVKLIRNKDLEDMMASDYRPKSYARYDTYLPEYRDAAKQRLAQFLGYTPAVQYSLLAELWMRELMTHDQFQMPEEATWLDRKALTFIQYREVLLTKGRALADILPLWGCEPALVHFDTRKITRN